MMPINTLNGRRDPFGSQTIWGTQTLSFASPPRDEFAIIGVST